MPKTKNILIFAGIAVAFVLIYIFFIKAPSSDTAGLVTSGATSTTPLASDANTPAVAQDFLNLLLSVNSIKLNDAILSDNAFASLHDSTIVLVPDGTEGRPNPFAPFGSDVVNNPPTPITSQSTTTTPTPNITVPQNTN